MKVIIVSKNAKNRNFIGFILILKGGKNIDLSCVFLDLIALLHQQRLSLFRPLFLI